MRRPRPSVKSELQMSPKLVTVALVVFGLMLIVLSDTVGLPVGVLELNAFVLLIYAGAATILLVNTWRPWLGRSLALVGMVSIVNLGSSWLGISSFWALVTLPVVAAAGLFDLSAAAITAAAQTILLVVLPNGFASARDPVPALIALAPWAAFAVMCALYSRAYQLSKWSWRYSQWAQESLEEARDRKVELAQTLEDLEHAHRQMALNNERLSALRQIADESQKTKAAFVAKVSHEFRTPLNMIIGLVDLLVEAPDIYGKELPPLLLEDLEIVRRNCDHLSSMIDDVLDLSQAGAGQLALHKERVDLRETIERAVSIVDPLLEKKGLDREITVPDDLLEVYCDRTRIRQVILNLVSNAARFTEIGGITIDVKRQDHYVKVSITDTGPGIPPEDARNIFEPFYQGNDGLWREKSGSGLGLSISKEFVKLHGGDIHLESEVGVGTTISFTLPASAPVAHIARPGHQIRSDWVWIERQSRPKLPDSHYRPRVVVCDQTGELRAAFSHYYCGSEEVELCHTENLNQAIEEIERCPAHALLVNNPSIDSLLDEVARARERTPDTPVIGCCVPPQMAPALKAGAVNYLRKPVTRDDLAEAIAAVGKPVRRVLVVDDDPSALQLFARMLHTCDRSLEVVTATSGGEALDQLRHHPTDLILLDVVMHDMDGWEVLARKSRSETIRDIPVIFVSGQDPSEEPLSSEVMVATLGKRIPLSKLLSCSFEFSRTLLPAH